MRDRPSAAQIGTIDSLVDQLGLDDMGRFRRLRTIVGHPVNALSQLTPDQADQVIRALEADARQPTLPYGGTP